MTSFNTIKKICRPALAVFFASLVFSSCASMLMKSGDEYYGTINGEKMLEKDLPGPDTHGLIFAVLKPKSREFTFDNIVEYIQINPKHQPQRITPMFSYYDAVVHEGHDSAQYDYVFCFLPLEPGLVFKYFCGIHSIGGAYSSTIIYGGPGFTDSTITFTVQKAGLQYEGAYTDTDNFLGLFKKLPYFADDELAALRSIVPFFAKTPWEEPMIKRMKELGYEEKK